MKGREKKVVGEVITPGQCFPRASTLSRSQIVKLHFDRGDTLTNVLFISSSCEMGLVFLNFTTVVQNNIY